MKIDEATREGALICYEGTIHQAVIEEICSILREHLDSDNRYLTLFIEQAQNILRYSSQSSQGRVVVGQKDKRIFIMSGNPIEKEREIQLKEKLELLTHETKEELKQMFKDQLHRDQEKNKGAGLGLIDIIRKSDNVEYDFTPMKNGKTFFSIKTEYNN